MCQESHHVSRFPRCVTKADTTEGRLTPGKRSCDERDSGDAKSEPWGQLGVCAGGAEERAARPQPRRLQRRQAGRRRRDVLPRLFRGTEASQARGGRRPGRGRPRAGGADACARVAPARHRHTELAGPEGVTAGKREVAVRLGADLCRPTAVAPGAAQLVELSERDDLVCEVGGPGSASPTRARWTRRSWSGGCIICARPMWRRRFVGR